MSSESNATKTTDVSTSKEDKPNTDSSDTTKKKVAWGKGNKQGNKQSSSQNQKKRFQGGTTGLEEHIFFYGKGMDTKFVTSKEHLLNYVAKKYSASEEVSLEKGTPTLLGVTTPSNTITEEEYKKMSFVEKEKFKITLKRHAEASDLLLKNLTACYAIIWGQLTENLKNYLRRESTFKTIHEARNAPELFALIGTICTRTIGIDHPASKVVDHLYSIMTLSGEKMGLSEFYKQFVAKMKGNAVAGITFASAGLQTSMLANYREKTGLSSVDPKYTSYKADIKEHCNQQVYALIFMKQAGERYEECRRDIKNDYYKGNDNIPATVDEAFALLQRFVPSTKPTRSQPNKGNGNNSKKSNDSTKDEEYESNAKGKHPAHTFQQSFS